MKKAASISYPHRFIAFSGDDGSRANHAFDPLFYGMEALREYDALEGIDWGWQSLDGAMTKAPLGGEKNRPQSRGSRQIRDQAFPSYGWRRRSTGRRGVGRQHA